MKEKNVFSILKEEISQNNVLAMAELIAMSETRFLIGYMGSPMQKMHTDLYVDILRKNEFGYVFSDSYDLVQEGSMFLCDHYGKHLNDVVDYSKRGKPITIEIACIRKMTKLINRKTSSYFHNVSLEALTPANEPYTETQEETVQDYTTYDAIVESLNLTKNMRIALECRIKGLSFPEIGRVLSRAQSTVFEYFIKMRQRYTAIYG
ncbi:MAG: hypothetical protein SOT34_04295 [Candidatus Borkfalkiaceae bacterium]|nr:hypothetical protein [Christensenellaceae bacterium]